MISREHLLKAPGGQAGKVEIGDQFVQDGLGAEEAAGGRQVRRLECP